MDKIFEYYLIDWIGISLALLAVYLLGNKKKLGFIVFAISNIVWMYLGFVMMNSIGTAVGNSIFLIINIRGYINWQNETTN
ncbi:hypothetical protein [Aureibacter tunicatorum]|uniref:Fatty-acid desaturase n=1 Tax=Aureibacter tunicatorum TaxID=866807 RepID=A0AAE3XSQ0_9BACT|nr:hypothetical protein [Aureibacter tunicatorum]MDR6241186.1 fatty-acid desaturase [Aureibacter tunicatorum]BDD03961.1 hypothetical protein AUTU_14440 [Aureibacter tunicatorum]